MSDTEKNLPEKQVKIYLAVLAGLLVIAVVVTMLTVGQEQPQAQESETPEQISEQTAQESQPAQPVQHNFLDADSRIEAEEETQESGLQAAEEPEEALIPQEPEEAAEPQETAAFDPDQDRMVWPVSGNVLMDYSPDALIYDATLDLYRTNDSISIGAAEAEEVLAAAAGTVLEIGESDTLGHYVVLDNGSGYETTYGQLSEEILVEVGETVAQGEAIGYVGAPSWYSSALGTHLTFSVSVSGETANPLDYLEYSLDD